MKKVELKKAIQEAVTNVCTRKIENIDSIVEKIVTSAIYSLLGISHSYGERAEIDHCNGRHSILTKVIEEKAKDKVERLVGTLKFDKAEKTFFEKAFKDEFKSQFKYQIKTYALEAAKGVAADMVRDFTLSEMKKLGFEEEKKTK